jgi:hypothetical protein
MAAALALAGLAARQVRSAEALISSEPATTFLAGLAGLFGSILAGTLAIVTILGIPLGLGIFIGVLPMMAFVGYLVAAIWVGEWILARRPGPRRERPYLAAVVGVLVLSIVSIVPILGGIVSFMGFGAIVLLMWRTLRQNGGTSEPAASAAALAV